MISNEKDRSIKILKFLDAWSEAKREDAVIESLTKEICRNCKEERNGNCACMRNICAKCNGPVGNITFSVCDECWDK